MTTMPLRTLFLVLTIFTTVSACASPGPKADPGTADASKVIAEPGTASAESERPRETLAFQLPPQGTDLVGKEHFIHTRASDTFADIAERYAIGYRELKIANPKVDPWLPGDNTQVELPQRFILPQAPRRGIVLNTAEMRLYYYFPLKHPNEVITFPVGVGQGKWLTPVTTTKVVGHIANPAWYPPASIRAEYHKEGRKLASVVPAGPDNPLGQYAMKLGIPGYFIHGTNHPFAIGMQVSHGCIRLHPHDIKLLFNSAAQGTPVTIVYQPYKAGWQNGVLYLEAHPQLDFGAGVKPPDLSEMVAAVIHATKDSPDYWVNWKFARQIARHPDGLPHAIGKRAAPKSETVSRR